MALFLEFKIKTNINIPLLTNTKNYLPGTYIYIVTNLMLLLVQT